MKKLIVLIFALYGFTLLAQEKDIKKPEYVIIANNQVITKEKLGELGQQGLIKGMNKGVTEEKRNELAEKFGDKIGDREFVIIIDLLTEKEKAERQKKATLDNKKISAVKNRNNELKLNINDTASQFTVQMIDGQKINLSELKGKVVLLNYWATWCAPCKKEMIFLEEFHKKYSETGFRVLAISTDSPKSMSKVKSYIRAKKHTFLVGLDPNQEVAKKMNAILMPTVVLIDSDRKVSWYHQGFVPGDEKEIEVQILKLLDLDHTKESEK
mgnify:CR=1 FL=1